MKKNGIQATRRALAGLVGLGGLAACATSSPTTTTYRVAAHEASGRPVSVAVTLDASEDEGPQFNQWGGVIPEAIPTTEVEDGGLGEIN